MSDSNQKDDGSDEFEIAEEAIEEAGPLTSFDKLLGNLGAERKLRIKPIEQIRKEEKNNENPARRYNRRYAEHHHNSTFIGTKK